MGYRFRILRGFLANSRITATVWYTDRCFQLLLRLCWIIWAELRSVCVLLASGMYYIPDDDMMELILALVCIYIQCFWEENLFRGDAYLECRVILNFQNSLRAAVLLLQCFEFCCEIISKLLFTKCNIIRAYASQILIFQLIRSHIIALINSSC